MKFQIRYNLCIDFISISQKVIKPWLMGQCPQTNCSSDHPDKVAIKCSSSSISRL